MCFIPLSHIIHPLSFQLFSFYLSFTLHLKFFLAIFRRSLFSLYASAKEKSFSFTTVLRPYCLLLTPLRE
jgi:hypothetical protein